MFIKFGTRKNLIYPALLVLFIGLLKVVESGIEEIYKKKGDFLSQFVWQFSKISFGAAISLYNYYSLKGQDNSNAITEFLNSENNKAIQDSKFKLFVLIFFASYFDYFVSIVRTFYIKGDSISKSIKNRIRCFQLFMAGILCHFTIRTKMYRHHIFSLISIFICLMLIVVTEIIYKESGIVLDNSYKALYLTVVSNLGRSFLDTIEKYLYDFSYMDPFFIMMLQGIINSLGFLVYYFLSDRPPIFKYFNKDKPIKSKKWLNILIYFGLFLLYCIGAGFRNVYKVLTVKYFSPMTRALTEALFDPFFIAYKIRKMASKSTWPFFVINIFSLLAMVFFSLIFSEFIILYCCGLEYNTHKEIYKRSESIRSTETTKIDIDPDYELNGGLSPTNSLNGDTNSSIISEMKILNSEEEKKQNEQKQQNQQNRKNQQEENEINFSIN